MWAHDINLFFDNFIVKTLFTPLWLPYRSNEWRCGKSVTIFSLFFNFIIIILYACYTFGHVATYLPWYLFNPKYIFVTWFINEFKFVHYIME